MRIRNVALLLIAFVVAGGSALMVRGVLNAQRQAPAVAEKEAPAPGTFVLVAKSAMKPGDFVQPANLEWVAWPKEGAIEGFAVKGARKLEDFVGSVARTQISKGEPIIEARFVKPGDRGFLAAVLTPGNRAMTVPLTATSGNAGFIFPGDRVDLILTAKYADKSKEGGEKDREYAATVLSGLRVLAIDQKTDNTKGETVPGKTATLEVTPKEAEMVALATQMGHLALSLQSLSSGDSGDSAALAQGESVSAASARASDSSAKNKAKQGPSYTLDSEMRFVLDARGTNGSVTILRGSSEEKKTSTQ